MVVRRPLDAKVELLEAFDYSFRVSEYLVGALPKRLWQAHPPDGNGRSIAAIVAHMQSVRRTFAKMSGATVALVLDRKRSTSAEAGRALRQSREALTGLFRGALERDKPRVNGMPRRTVNM